MASNAFDTSKVSALYEGRISKATILKEANYSDDKPEVKQTCVFGILIGIFTFERRH